MKTKLLALIACTALLAMSHAEATTYTVVGEPFKTQCGSFPACPITGSLTGTITTDGTLGVGLSPSIITGWKFLLNDGTDPVVNLTTANSFITYNFSDLLSATSNEMDFNFSQTPCCANIQQNLEFTLSSNGAAVVTIFAALPSSPQGGIGFDAGYSGAELVAYLSGTQPIADLVTNTTPLPAALPLFAGGLGALGLLGWRRKRKSVTAIAAA